MRCSWCECEIASDDENAFVVVTEDDEEEGLAGSLFCSGECFIASL